MTNYGLRSESLLEPQCLPSRTQSAKMSKTFETHRWSLDLVGLEVQHLDLEDVPSQCNLALQHMEGNTVGHLRSQRQSPRPGGIL
jgi:hypothetical protein